MTIRLLRLKTAAAVCLMCAVLSGAALADGELIPIGEAIGIRISVDGVLVTGTTEISTDAGAVSPARVAGIRAGDVITAADGKAVENAASLVGAIGAPGEKMELTVVRDGRELRFTVTPAEEAGGGARLGLWLRDGITGIGTVTYIDPETGAFGALGHGINDTQTGALLPVGDGDVFRARIVDVKRGEVGVPGELEGSFDAGEVLGSVEENTEHGVFGVMERAPSSLYGAMPVASPGEVMPGAATILTCVGGQQAREYEVEISRAGFARGGGRDLMIRVTDPALLALTGGIVQGMSGSPILQGGKLVGAVTHVLTGDPTRGYGIYAENMLRAARAA